MKIYQILPIILFIIGFICGSSIPLDTFKDTTMNSYNILPNYSFSGILFNSIRVVIYNLIGGIFLVPMYSIIYYIMDLYSRFNIEL